MHWCVCVHCKVKTLWGGTAVHISIWRFADPDYKTNMHAATDRLVQKQKKAEDAKNIKNYYQLGWLFVLFYSFKVIHLKLISSLYLLPLAYSMQKHAGRLLVVVNVYISSTSQPAASSDGFVMWLFWSETCGWLSPSHVALFSLFYLWFLFSYYDMIVICLIRDLYVHKTYVNVFISQPAVAIPQRIPAALAWTAPPPICNTEHR